MTTLTIMRILPREVDPMVSPDTHSDRRLHPSSFSAFVTARLRDAVAGCTQEQGQGLMIGIQHVSRRSWISIICWNWWIRGSSKGIEGSYRITIDEPGVVRGAYSLPLHPFLSCYLISLFLISLGETSFSPALSRRVTL